MENQIWIISDESGCLEAVAAGSDSSPPIASMIPGYQFGVVIGDLASHYGVRGWGLCYAYVPAFLVASVEQILSATSGPLPPPSLQVTSAILSSTSHALASFPPIVPLVYIHNFALQTSLPILILIYAMPIPKSSISTM